MHDVRVELKDGTVFCAPLWTWRPDLGWFTLAGIEKTFLLGQVRSVTERGVRTLFGTEDVDLLARARKEGWNGS